MRLVLSRLFGLNLENTSDAYLPEIIGLKSIFNAIFCVQKQGTLKREKSGKNVANFYALERLYHLRITDRGWVPGF